MKVKKAYFLVTFQTTNDAMNLEKVTKKSNLSVKLIPAPRSMTPGCGMALRCEVLDREKVESLIKEYDIETEDEVIYEL